MVDAVLRRQIDAWDVARTGTHPKATTVDSAIIGGRLVGSTLIPGEGVYNGQQEEVLHHVH